MSENDTKLETNAANGIDALMALLRRKPGRSAARLRRTSASRGARPESMRASVCQVGRSRALAKGEKLIAVIDDEGTVVGLVGKIPASVQKQMEVALRLADVELIANRLLEQEPASSFGDVALTQQEERLLGEGGHVAGGDARRRIDPIARTTAEYAALLEDSLIVEEAAGRLGVNSSRIRQRVSSRARTLLGIKLGKEWRLPSFQFARTRVVPGFDEVLPRLPCGMHPVAIHRWFTLPNVDLYLDEDEKEAVSPLDWLKMGRPVETIISLASRL